MTRSATAPAPPAPTSAPAAAPPAVDLSGLEDRVLFLEGELTAAKGQLTKIAAALAAAGYAIDPPAEPEPEPPADGEPAP